MAMRAIVTACPVEELLFFNATVNSAPSGETLLVGVSEKSPCGTVSQHQQYAAAAADIGCSTTILGLNADAAGRFVVDDLSKRLAEVFVAHAVTQVFTYSIQGDKGRRYRADVAMAVWRATGGARAFFRAKHTDRVVLAIPSPLKNLIAAYQTIVGTYALGAEVADSWIAHEDLYTNHTAEEALVAYHELSRGLDGVRFLASNGDTDPWGYYSSPYAASRGAAVARLVAGALEGRRRGVVWEIGPASGHITRRLLALTNVHRVLAVECCSEFDDAFNHWVGADSRLVRQAGDVRDISVWDCDVAVLVDCLDFYLSPSDQLSVVDRVIDGGAALVLGGEAAWTKGLVDAASRGGRLATQAMEHGPGAFEPVRRGHSVHCSRPPWAAFLLANRRPD